MNAVVSCGFDGAVRVWALRRRELRVVAPSGSGDGDADGGNTGSAGSADYEVRPLDPELVMVQDQRRADTQFKCVAYQFDANARSHDVICATETGETLVFPLNMVALTAALGEVNVVYQ